MEEGSLVAEFEEGATEGVALAHTGPGVGDNVPRVVAHLGRSAIFPAEEACYGSVAFHNSVEDRAVAYSVEGVCDIDGDDGVLLAKGNVCHTGTEFNPTAETASGLGGVKAGSDSFASDVGCRSTEESADCALDADGAVLIAVLGHHVEAS